MCEDADAEEAKLELDKVSFELHGAGLDEAETLHGCVALLIRERDAAVAKLKALKDDLTTIGRLARVVLVSGDEEEVNDERR